MNNERLIIHYEEKLQKAQGFLIYLRRQSALQNVNKQIAEIESNEHILIDTIKALKHEQRN